MRMFTFLMRWHVAPSGPYKLNHYRKVDKVGFRFSVESAEAILENSDSVLILGKDTGLGMAKLKTIGSKLQERGYYTFIIKDGPDWVRV